MIVLLRNHECNPLTSVLLMQLTQSVIFRADKLQMCHGMYRSQNTIDIRVFIHYHNNQRYYGAMGYSDSYF